LSDIFQKLKTDGKVKERTVVQAMKYISNRKDGTKRNPKNRLADGDVMLKVQFALAAN